MMPVVFILLALSSNGAGAAKIEQGVRLRESLAVYDSAVAAKKGNGAEAQKLYRQALAGFTTLLTDGVRTSGLYYDIANTYVHLGDVARAIVNYRRALRLDPGNEKVRKNLEVARQMCQARINRPATSSFIETLLFWHYGTSLSVRLRTSLILYVVFWLTMLVGLLARRSIPAVTWTSVIAAGLWLIVTASVVWDKQATTHRIEGVIVADQVTLRKGNGDYYDPQFERTLPSGVEFRVLEDRQDVQGALWYHIELADGKNGWLRADQSDVI